MGVEYRAAVVVGLPEEELEEYFKQFEDYYGSELEHFSPYYDAPYSAGVHGIAVIMTSNYQEKQIDAGEFGVKLRAAQHEFHRLTGLAGQLYVTPIGY